MAREIWFVRVFRRRPRGAIFWKAILIVVLPFVVACSSVNDSRPRPVVTVPGSELRIGSYNVLAGTRDPKGTAAVIRKMGADLVALQEVAPEGAKLLDVELQRDFRHRYFSNGHGILSRFPIRNPRFERSERGINGFLFAEIDEPRGRVQIASLHLDPLRLWTTKDRLALPLQLLWKQAGIHRGELAQIERNLRPGPPTILMGDFNSADDTIPKALRQRGFTDSFAAVTPEADDTSTLHFRTLGMQFGRRIDYIFHDAAFTTVRSRVLPGHPSDHDAVVSVLAWKKR